MDYGNQCNFFRKIFWIWVYIGLSGRLLNQERVKSLPRNPYCIGYCGIPDRFMGNYIVCMDVDGRVYSRSFEQYFFDSKGTL